MLWGGVPLLIPTRVLLAFAFTLVAAMRAPSRPVESCSLRVNNAGKSPPFYRSMTPGSSGRFVNRKRVRRAVRWRCLHHLSSLTPVQFPKQPQTH